MKRQSIVNLAKHALAVNSFFVFEWCENNNNSSNNNNKGGT